MQLESRMPNMRDPEYLKDIVEKIKADRHWLHAHPEIGFKETQTAEYICTRLKALDIPFESGIAETGIVATIKGQGSLTSAIGLRADMDALPVKEENTFSYCSRHDRLMHACGHDGHVAILLGVAELLSRERDFDGTVYLIFQPAEEGFAGAQRMIDEKLFERFPMDRVFALHNWPTLPSGCVGTLKGPIMASSHYLSIRIKGKGGHGAAPHQATPQMTIAAHIQLAINSYIAQQFNTQYPVVVSLTQISAGEAIAVLPEIVHMEGSCRLLEAGAKEKLFQDLPPLVMGITAAFGAVAEVKMMEGYPATVNDPAATELVRKAAASLGLEQQDEHTGLLASMASEDFSYMLNQIPGCYFWLGQGSGAAGKTLHQSTYDFNDDVLETGVNLFARIVDHAFSGK